MAENTVKDSGQHREFASGAKRDHKEKKGRYDLLPPFALKDLAILFQNGCIKYGAYNWTKGIPVGEYIDSGLRHIEKFQMGLEDENHLIMGAWNLLCAYDTLMRIQLGLLPKELDDLQYPLRDADLDKIKEVLGDWIQ